MWGRDVQLQPFPNLGTRWRFVVNFTPRQIYPQEVTHRIGGWMGTRDGLEDLDGGKSAASVRN